jgi:Fe-S cluster biogenesis protein NfuA/nitrite reductase/ring-hydroxylating ferredoxin subunit
LSVSAGPRKPEEHDAPPDEVLARVQELQARLEAAADATTRELAEELISAVVQMYGAGLERVLACLMNGGPEGERLALALADDPRVATLLFIHDLHPVALEQRVRGALEQVRPYMESHGGNVELLSLQDGVARIRLRGSCSDCQASSVTLELAIKHALEEAAPDLEGLEVEGVAAPALGVELPMANATAAPPQAPGGGLELPMVLAGGAQARPRAEPPAPSWFELRDIDKLGVGEMVAAEVAGADLVVANVEGTLLAYHDRCAACGAALRGGHLQDGALGCPACARTFFLPSAGRSMDADRLQLEPVPLLREQGAVKVALPA